MVKNQFFSLWWRITLEIILWLIILGIVDTLAWWLVVFIGKSIWSCSLTDSGLFKPPHFSCDKSLFGANFFEPAASSYSEFSTLLFFFLLMFFAAFFIALPVMLVILIVIGLAISLLIYYLYLQNHPQKISFPFLIRSFVNFVRRKRNKNI